jgi:hypothetical protein
VSAREVLDEIQARAVDGPESDWDPHGGDEPHYRAIERAIRFEKRLRADSLTLVAALRAVLDLHPAQDDHRSFLEGPYCAGDCTTDGNREQWPCPTVRAVTEALDGTR